MDQKPVTESYKEEVNALRSKLCQLEVDSIEEKASDEVRKWRQSFDTSSSRQIDKVLNEMEKRKQTEVKHLANELRTSLEQFKQTNLKCLAELDAFISRIGLDDEIQLDYVKFQLDSITKKINSLHFNIIVQVVDKSHPLRPSTALTRKSLELVKVFECTRQRSTTDPSSFLDPLRNLFRRASASGANYYNTDVLEPHKHP
ncbi:unnamed protein product [Rotaria sp. Silwood1]|nr:unnamed protein product [Rotaria sp. Silwood1]CAF1085936.1 unnamed protein product [Rotaria sp. Silwood1]CAF1108286.1 unnamed protein product [Rotaria sp. Silwood1]CAF3418830.1 unnamed protein product [Rotaria sp. Silwood1]CAF3443616.1 unnamed protein product [Rotaria sp. Silwood1]